MRLSLNLRILIGAVFGVTGGIILSTLGKATPAYMGGLYTCDILGGVFVNLLKMILIPLVFTSISVGIANLKHHSQMSRVWRYTLIYFFLTSALAVLLGLICVNVFKPGAGLNLSLFQESLSTFKAEDMSLQQFLKTFLSNLFLNPVAAMAKGEVLPTVIFAFFLGIGLVVSGERGQTLQRLLTEIFDVIMLIVSWIMRLAPIGIMALLMKMIATQDVNLLAALGKFVGVVVGATLFHGLIVLPFILYVFTKTNPLFFFSGMKEAFITAFSTSSSSATLPVTIRCVKDNLKVDKDIAGFVLPLGATINMDGTALYEAIAAIFVANLVGIELNLVQQSVVFFTAILASIGAPGIPSAGFVTMIMVLQSVGLPTEAIAILLPIDRPLDALRTVVNVEGDCVGSLIVQRLTLNK